MKWIHLDKAAYVQHVRSLRRASRRWLIAGKAAIKWLDVRKPPYFCVVFEQVCYTASLAA